MAAGGPWSVKGIDPRARETALEAARREGKTLGEWLNAIILEGDDEPPGFAGARPDPYAYEARGGGGGGDDDLPSKLRALSERLEAVEQRSTMAITGIDQSMKGVIARLEKAEADAGETRDTHDTLAERLQALESDERPEQSVRAVKGLEDAVATVAGHVHERDKRAHGRFGEVEDRLSALGDKLEKAAEDLGRRIDSASDHAAMQARRETESLRQAFETHKDDAETALTGLKDAVERINERLGSAERLTDNAVRALEASFANLDDRLRDAEESIQANSEAGVGERLERRFESLSEELKSAIADSRQSMADELQKAASAPRLDRLEQTLARSEKRHADTLAKLGRQIELLGDSVERRVESAERRLRSETSQERGLETRLRELETNSAGAARRIGDELLKVSERLTERIEASEARNAEAVSALADRLDRRLQEDEAAGGRDGGEDGLESRLKASEERTQAMIREAIAGVGAKLDAVRDENEEALSPVQSALASLARRLDAIESGDAPTADGPAPKTPEPGPLKPAESALDDDPEPEEDAYYVDAPETGAARANPFSGVGEAGPDDDAVEADAFGADSPFDPTSDLMFVDEPYGSRETAEPAAPSRPAPLGATADPNFLRSARSVMQKRGDAGESRDRGSPILGGREDNQGGGFGRAVLIGAGALATLALIGAAAMLVLNGGEPDAGPRLAAPDGATVGDLLAETDAGAAGTETPAPAETPAEPPVEEAAAEAEDAAAATAESALEEPADAPAEAPADAEAAQPAPTPQPDAPEEAPVETPVAEAAPQPDAATAGDPVSAAAAALAPPDLFQLGLAYLQSGETAAGARIVRAAADAGYPPAQYRLGKLYETGLGVAEDPLQARQWTERAANAGNRKAMHNLGVMYAEGRGAPQDMNAAAQWFERAALAGSPDSQFNLAVLYEQGRGRPRSLPDALAWYSIAARSGDQEAASRADALAGELPEEAVAEARQAASGFAPRPLDSAANAPAEDGDAALAGPAAVARAQAVLAQLGYDAGPPDGAIGPRTRAAIIRYQRDNGLAQTGEVSPRLLERLEVSRAR